MKNHRAVGGLISLIGLVIVFGISSTAYLELTSIQGQSVNTSLKINHKISEQQNQYLNFSNISTIGSQHKFDIENLGSETVIIESYLAVNGKSIIGKSEQKIKIFAAEKTTDFTVDVSATNSGDKIIIITELGKKCIVPMSVSFRTC